MKYPNRPLTLVQNFSLGLLILALPQIVRADSVPATVTTVSGTVAVTDVSGKPVDVVVGSKLPAGDTVKTGTDGKLGLVLTPGSGTVVMPNSEMKIGALDFNKGADGSNNRTIRLNLKNGNLISTLFKKDGHSDFQVATPYGVAAAKGTTWSVAIGTGMTVNVANGVVTVTNAAGVVIASIPGGQGYDSTTGAITTLPQSVVDAITDAISTALPNLAPGAITNALKNATVNPSTTNNKNDINSKNN